MTAEDPKSTEQAGAPAAQPVTPSEEALASELDKPVEHVEGTAPQNPGGSGPIRPTHTTGAQ
ncbi:hypothetical protein [Streptomyces telluris]|uniref:Uncharacterized protein n=1 Tax=Streptomyces telluris TaxID=2720021 RepID=A0A9X2LE42_9ACTN|nr:hypothetical protein [Streptomyces telluris]MCQ8768320.1 hypothetical protein [Streptomyces telluris]NJP76922.1 hypothetical protein [Streptomyces telluris]